MYVAPSAPGSTGRLQRVDPFTVAPEMPAPESVTPSADLRRFPANFISKIALLKNITLFYLLFKFFFFTLLI